MGLKSQISRKEWELRILIRIDPISDTDSTVRGQFGTDNSVRGQFGTWTFGTWTIRYVDICYVDMAWI